MSDERQFHERDLYRRYVDRGIAIEAALVWLKVTVIGFPVSNGAVCEKLSHY